MQRTAALLFLLLAPTAPALAQSGRKGTAPAPSASPAPSTTPDKLQLVKPTKSSLPQFVDGERIYTWKEVDEKAQITKRPSPGYTREARNLRTQGYVILRAILAADETVKHIEIITGLPDGLSQQAIEATEQIKFKPAKKDSKAVSVWVELEYQFKLY